MIKNSRNDLQYLSDRVIQLNDRVFITEYEETKHEYGTIVEMFENENGNEYVTVRLDKDGCNIIVYPDVVRFCQDDEFLPALDKNGKPYETLLAYAMDMKNMMKRILTR